jgi:CRP/FNR family transcriptional regulator
MLGRLHRDYQGGALPFTRQELANMTGTTVESAIRTLSRWEKQGVIRSDRGQIEVRQPQSLEECAA